MTNEEESNFLQEYMKKEYQTLAEEIRNPDNWKNKHLNEKVSVMREKSGGNENDK